MCSTITLRNIVGETINILLITIIPLQSNFDSHIVLVAHTVQYVLVYWRSVAIEVLNKCADAAFVFEDIGFFGTQIIQDDTDPAIQK